MKINYTIFGSTIPIGGIRGILELANQLVARGHDVSITHCGRPQAAQWFPLRAALLSPRLDKWLLLKGAGYALERFADRRSFRVAVETELLLDTIPECDINVAVNWESTFAVYRSNCGCPFHHMQHFELLFVNSPRDKMHARETYYLPLEKVANSSWLRQQILAEFGIHVPVVPNAISHEVFYPRPIPKPVGKKLVVCYGRDTRWKGFADAVQAMKLVFQKRSDVEWAVYGRYPPKQSDPEAPYRLYRSPTDDQLAILYSSANVFFSPSWYESFPAPPLEAMACRVPVVTTRYGTEDYAFHEENSLVVEPREPQAMAEAILRVLSDDELSARLRQNGLQTAKQFTWEKTADALENLFKAALGQ